MGLLVWQQLGELRLLSLLRRVVFFGCLDSPGPISKINGITCEFEPERPDRKRRCNKRWMEDFEVGEFRYKPFCSSS
jgi:hypothetical protein